MKISPSIASADILNISDEVMFANQYFNDIHLDVADGVAVQEISFGLKMCKKISEIARLPISIHLEVSNPLQYVEQVKSCCSGVTFLQVDCLSNAREVIHTYQKNQIRTGVNISHLDLNRNDLEELLDMTEHILVNTTYHSDLEQTLKLDMLNYAIYLANHTQHKVWIDGAIDWEVLKNIQNTKIYMAVMGRAIFSNKEKAVAIGKQLGFVR